MRPGHLAETRLPAPSHGPPSILTSLGADVSPELDSPQTAPPGVEMADRPGGIRGFAD